MNKKRMSRAKKLNSAQKGGIKDLKQSVDDKNSKNNISNETTAKTKNKKRRQGTQLAKENVQDLIKGKSIYHF